MPDAPLKTIIARIRKPLDFSSRDNFARINSLADMEAYMRRQLDELRRLTVPRNELEELGALFAGFDNLPPELKKERVVKAIEIIIRLEEGGPRTDSPAEGRDARVTGGAGNSLHQARPAKSESATPRNGEAEQKGHGEARISASTPIQYCKGIGPKRAELLRKIGISTVEDALHYLPWRYEDRSNLKKIAKITYGAYETVAGEVVSAEVVSTKRQRRKVFELVVTDKSGMLVGSWFNQPFMKKAFKVGEKVILLGTAKANPYRGGMPQMDSPDYEILEGGEGEDLIHTGRIVPIYRATAGLSVRAIRSMMKSIIDSCASAIPESLPEPLVGKYRLMPAGRAVAEAHFPEQERNLDVLNRGTSAAHRRMSFEELFALELGLALRKRGLSTAKKGIAFRPTGVLETALRKNLPYRLTAAQERVIAEIKRDMTAERAMNRLGQGDVGSGKTVVAVLALLTAVESGYQACLMAPTEILAEQHYRNLLSLVSPIGVTVRLLTGSVRKKEREALLAGTADGSVSVLVGTHALIEQDVVFHRLGLAIIDEQHRFGVLQRSTLTAKGYEPDVLVMTATPIPRTLALTVYGDLDVSVIDEMPPGRSPVITRLFFESKRQEAYHLIESELGKGRQVYVVYPLVEETEKSDLKAATEMAEHLQRDVFTKWKVGLLHGRMKAAEKDDVMTSFTSGETRILVSTTVIEVGVDVPNATVMVIEHPERFGLAQLHQLRGRVGRGGHQSYCILMGPRMFVEETRERLTAFTRTTDGFRIAEEDLRLRGPGEFFGTRQSGLPDLRAANIIRDADLLEKAREEAFALVREDPELRAHPLVRELVRKKWQGRLGLISVG